MLHSFNHVSIYFTFSWTYPCFALENVILKVQLFQFLDFSSHSLKKVLTSLIVTLLSHLQFPLSQSPCKKFEIVILKIYNPKSAPRSHDTHTSVTTAMSFFSHSTYSPILSRERMKYKIRNILHRIIQRWLNPKEALLHNRKERLQFMRILKINLRFNR